MRMLSIKRRQFIQQALALKAGFLLNQSTLATAAGLPAKPDTPSLESSKFKESPQANQNITELPNHSFKLKKSTQTETADYFSASKNAAGQFLIQQFDRTGRVLADYDLPKRGHSFAVSNDQWLIAIGRRPANYFLAFNLQNQKTYQLNAQHDRRFYGHGVFYENEGQLKLYLTENDLTSGNGVIGVYDVNENFARTGEIPSYGIGPHDIQLDTSKQLLVVANGGIKTHPATGRKKLNIATMQSSLAFVDPRTGDLFKQFQLPPDYQFNSIRHLAIDSDNNIYLALQNQSVEHKQCLIAIYRRGSNSIEPCTMPVTINQQLNHYIGNICLDKSEQYFLATSPKGNLAVLFTNEGEFIDSIQIDDVCGVEPSQKNHSFLVSTGKGSVYLLTVNPTSRKLEATELLKSYDQEIAWDNHIISMV